MPTRIKIRRDTKANWEDANPVLSDGELALEKDTGKIKIGNGINTYTELNNIMSGYKLLREIDIDGSIDITIDGLNGTEDWEYLFKFQGYITGNGNDRSIMVAYINGATTGYNGTRHFFGATNSGAMHGVDDTALYNNPVIADISVINLKTFVAFDSQIFCGRTDKYIQGLYKGAVYQFNDSRFYFSGHWNYLSGCNITSLRITTINVTEVVGTLLLYKWLK